MSRSSTHAATGIVSAGESFALRVVRWQRTHGRRSLPWQQTRDPYRVWLSEIMLQQTQVTTVLGYYERFLARFPTVVDLAAAPIDEVLAMWSGLGYYARARNLHRCAQVVAGEHGGAFPSTSAGLVELPGIGRSTAAAIAAFCFGERAAILDGNVKRVLTRVLADDGDLASARAERALWARAEALLPALPADAQDAAAQATFADDMVAYTQGLMDLGATVCAVRNPACDACPAAAICEARAQGAQERFPVKTRKLKRGRRAHALLWAQRPDGAVWLVQRPDAGVWAGLWSLPEFASAEALEAAVADVPGTLEWLAPFQHVLTHFDWDLQPLRLAWPAEGAPGVAAPSRWPPTGDGEVAGARWVPRDQLAATGLPSPIRRLLD
jgi:A/G-specific adenine glycosylase